MKLIIYLPALNEAANIQQAIATLPKALAPFDTVEHLVIDDGSTDATATLAASSGARVLSHNRNRGVGAAFRSAVDYALDTGADILVGMDADGQFDPEDIPALIKPILDNTADMVVGNRFGRGRPQHMPRLKYWGNAQIAKYLGYVCGQEFRDVSCGFRALGREALFRLNVFGDFTYTHETILSLAYQGLRIADYPVKITYHPDRKSRVASSLPSYALQTSKIIWRVMMDYRPIRVFGALAAICLLVGAAFELFLLGHYVLTHGFSPYKSAGFIGLGFMIFGMFVLLIALIADMLNRLRRSQDRLLYEVKRLRHDK
jgi:glycosyltransferase involved in cell wall biosynthesis